MNLGHPYLRHIAIINGAIELNIKIIVHFNNVSVRNLRSGNSTIIFNNFTRAHNAINVKIITDA